MGQWKHLFIDGEFMPRARLLSGLTVEPVSVRPPAIPHTIYEGKIVTLRQVIGAWPPPA